MAGSRVAVSSSTTNILRDLHLKKKEALLRLERAEKQKEEGSKYYRGTELPIDDVIFTIREGQLKSIDISIDFFEKDLEKNTRK